MMYRAYTDELILNPAQEDLPPVGTRVRALRNLEDWMDGEKYFHAYTGYIGVIEGYHRSDNVPTIRWPSPGRGYYDCMFFKDIVLVDVNQPAQLSRKERETLKEAAAILHRELVAGHEVRIPRFGKFTTTWNTFFRCHPSSDDGSWTNRYFRARKQVKFTPFKGLKLAFVTKAAPEGERVYAVNTPYEQWPDETPEQAKDVARFVEYGDEGW